MVFLHINNEKDELEEIDNRIYQLDKNIKSNKHVFLLIYMDGCVPCNMTRPEWRKLENVLNKKNGKRDDIIVADIDKDFLTKVKNLKHNVVSFPTIIYVSKYGKNIKNYEDSNIDNKDRSIDSFVDWIGSEIKNSNTSSRYSSHKRNTKNKTKKYRKSQMGGKWSLKYKRSINCKRPRGFSQKQYCKYGRNK